ncbi:phosphotransferase [Actinocrispum wychmicini]|uniref:Spectinomycin phosphotransferase n=1 Tax=Actinocrispum wychmicini TaxID=1213861 RepID=A0A4R2IPW8_9PSEU|nr:phosphotransferase [Actinocrispum wychmicini]TCO44795.1 spectinomycin phosphotransferase [Actinocrispum wychmicini]
MKDLPVGLDQAHLRRGLAEFGIDAVTTAYAPVGFGDYHWTVTGADGRQWFATVADLEDKPNALDGLRAAMDTAVALSDRHFVVAPLRAGSGETVVALNTRYGLSVFPFIAGKPGEFGQELPPQQRDQVLDVLAELHSAQPPRTTPHLDLNPEGRDDLDAVLKESAPWTGGPFSEPARHLLADNAGMVRARLEDFDRLADKMKRAPHVVTHGEPHPGNLILAPAGYLLVDWDTVGLAVPERDLSVLSDNPDDLKYYTVTTGRAVDGDALALYRLRWSLADVAAFTTWFRSPHERTPDTETAWQGLVSTIQVLTPAG